MASIESGGFTVMSRRSWQRAVSIAAVATSLLAPAVARADSLVFTRPDGNVWLANADGSGLYQVTLDGTPALGGRYDSPTQADDGTIVATRGSGPNERIYRMTQNGTVLSSFVPVVQFTLGLFDAQVSPDGSKVAYWTGYVGDSTCQEVSPGTPGAQFCYSTAISSSTSPTDLGGDLAFRTNASWISNTRLALGGRNYFVSTFDLGQATDVTWLNVGNPHNPEVSADGTRLVTTLGLGYEQIQLYETSGAPKTDGPPPGAPVPGCFLEDPVGGQFDDPTWSPGGERLAWTEGDGNSNTPPAAGEGIWIWNLRNTGDLDADCGTALPEAVAISGAESPDFGPANVDPAPRSTPKPTPSPTPAPPVVDRTAPAFSGAIIIRPTAFAAARKGSSISKRARAGATVSYRLSEAATVTFTIKRQRPGRRVGSRCVKPRRANRNRARCTRLVAARGTFSHAGKAGGNKFRFSGRLSGRTLKRGRYRLFGVARDAARNVSAPKQARFRIVRR